MMKQDAMRQKLMQSTMHIVAQFGIHGTTTKAISRYAELNEAYIYRLFEDKNDLFEKTFRALDEEVAAIVLRHWPIAEDRSLPLEERCWQFFHACWDELLVDREKWSFYIKYYHSQCFDSYSIEMRKRIFRPALDRLSSAFKSGTDVWMLFNHAMDLVFAGYLRFLRDESLSGEEMISSTYDLLYHSVQPYLAWTEPCETLRWAVI